MFNSCVSGALYRPLEQRVPKYVRSPHIKLASEVPECLVVEARPNKDNREDNAVLCGNAMSRVSSRPTELYATHPKTDDNSSSDDVIGDAKSSSRIRDMARDVCKTLDISLWKDRCFVLYAVSQAFSNVQHVDIYIHASRRFRQRHD